MLDYSAAAFALPFEILVPVDADFERHRPMFAVVGPGLPPPTDEVVGYESLSSGDKVYVVTYVHTYPEPIDTYPRVYWSGRWYYNVNGDFVFWSPAYGWVYYWGPPLPLVACWNGSRSGKAWRTR